MSRSIARRSARPGRPVLRDEPVPGNRWDLLTQPPPEAPRVSVVIVHYNQPLQLQRTLLGLAHQTLLPLDVVIADDGSSVLPTLRPSETPTRVVSQADRGFRAAAARNLGVGHTTGDILVFLDADTTPEPDFLRELTRRVAVCRDVVAVGRRRHAELHALPLGADPAGAVELDEPAWLRDGYASSRNLLDADGRSFRYIISAVLACRRDLYTELGGFDERFVGYGGEDWDFAYRAWNAGAIFVHEADAVAWHDGPDWAARQPRPGTHDRQSMRLAALIPEPSTRGAPLSGSFPDVLADLAEGLDTATVVRSVHSLLRQRFDLAVRVSPPVDAAVAELYGDTVRSTPWTPEQVRRARARLMLGGPLPPNALAMAMETLTRGDFGVVDLLTSGKQAATLMSTRASTRARRWSDRLPPQQVIDDHFGRRCLEVGAPPEPGRNLAQYFAGWG
jgi:GT2 family glycosyltransferase